MAVDAQPEPVRSVTFATLLQLAWPVVLARATQSVIGFTDALLVAPLGVRLAHSLSKRRLEVAFGIFLFIVCARFIASLVV